MVDYSWEVVEGELMEKTFKCIEKLEKKVRLKITRWLF